MAAAAEMVITSGLVGLEEDVYVFNTNISMRSQTGTYKTERRPEEELRLMCGTRDGAQHHASQGSETGRLLTAAARRA